MNPSLSFVFKRRSVRKFQDRPIAVELIHDILEAAMAAPSAVARDPWHFIVVRERPALNALADILPHAPMLRHAPAAVIAGGDIALAHDGLESYLLQDISAAVENLLLAATAMGLGTCWLGVHPRTERMDGIRRLYNLPSSIVPVAGIALGWPAEQPAARTRFVAGRVHWDQW